MISPVLSGLYVQPLQPFSTESTLSLDILLLYFRKIWLIHAGLYILFGVVIITIAQVYCSAVLDSIESGAAVLNPCTRNEFKKLAPQKFCSTQRPSLRHCFLAPITPCSGTMLPSSPTKHE